MRIQQRLNLGQSQQLISKLQQALRNLFTEHSVLDGKPLTNRATAGHLLLNVCCSLVSFRQRISVLSQPFDNMYRGAVRVASRQTFGGLRSQSFQNAPRRFASTATPTYKPRTWKGSALRWGLALGAVYYYNTSSVFADEATGMSK